MEIRKSNTRIEWIDFAKGITILLVVIGHTVYYNASGSILRGVIFSFHMPLFFALSAATFRSSENRDDFLQKTKKAAKHLLVPAIVLFVIIIVIECIKEISLCSNIGYWQGKLYTLIFSSGVGAGFNGADIAPIGVPWFLIALFLGRTIFDWMHLSLKDDRKLFIVSILLCMAGLLFGQMQWLPFSMDIAFATMPFFFFGYKLTFFKIEKTPFRKLLICFAIWLVTLYITFPNYNSWSYLELASRRYPLFPICFICAIAGILVMSEFSVLCCRISVIKKPIVFLGKYSLYMLCVHSLDEQWSFLWNVEGHQFQSALKRVGIDLAIFVLVMLFVWIIKSKLERKVKSTN